MGQFYTNERAEQGYLLYRAHRVIKKVADLLEVDPSTVSNWKTKYSWDERLKEEDNILEQGIDIFKKSNILFSYDSELAELKKLKEILDACLVLDNIRPKSWKDVLDTYLRLCTRRDQLLTRIQEEYNLKTNKGKIKDVAPEEEVIQETLDEFIRILGPEDSENVH